MTINTLIERAKENMLKYAGTAHEAYWLDRYTFLKDFKAQTTKR